MADGFSSKTTGLDKVDKKIQFIKKETMHTYGAQIRMQPTSGVYRRVNGPDETENRSEGKNIVIIRTQAKKGRDPLPLDDAEKAIINDFWIQATMGFVDEKRHEIEKHVDKVADMIKNYILKHIDESKNIKPVKPGTQRRKDREGIKPDLPPLIRTGQLIRSFVAKSVRR